MAIVNLVDNLILESIVTPVLKGFYNLFKTEANSIKPRVNSLDELINFKGGELTGQAGKIVENNIIKGLQLPSDKIQALKQAINERVREAPDIWDPVTHEVKKPNLINHIKHELTEFITGPKKVPYVGGATRDSGNIAATATSPAIPWSSITVHQRDLLANKLDAINSATGRFGRPEFINHAVDNIANNPGGFGLRVAGVTALTAGTGVVANNSKNSHTGVINANGQEMINPIAKGQHVVYASPEVPITKIASNTVYVDPQTNTQFNPNNQHNLSNGLVAAGVGALGAYGLYKYLKHKHKNDGMD